ncbi:MAG: endonuclease/exonuclease/phosphatase family protein [Gammaproteobacteria bacterium]
MRYIILLLLIPVNCLVVDPVFAAEVVNRPGIDEEYTHRPKVEGRLVNATSIKVMTFNIRWQGHSNGVFYDSGFDRRKPLVLDVLKNFDADVIGLQEASIEQRAAIASELTEFAMFPLPSDAGDESILYRISRFDLEASGHEYLRREPEKPGTNIGVRDFFWVHLYDRLSDKRFYVANLHTDHRSSERGRQLDGVLIGEWIRQRKFADPVILTGDFNGKPDQPRYLYLTGQRAYAGEDGSTVSMPVPMLDTFTAANRLARHAGAVNASNGGENNSNRIDYIFVPRGSKVIDSRVIYKHVNGAYPSDHFPLFSEIELE